MKFGQFQSELETEIGLSAWKKSGLIESYDGLDNDSIATEPDVVIDDDETPTASQSMTDELLTMNLNDSQSELSESITENRNLIQSSISRFFTKK